VTTAGEEDFLASILNSSISNDAIKPFQSMGLLGERDIEKKLSDLPIPHFKPEDSRHVALVELGQHARERIRNILKLSDLPASLARQRAWVREQLKNELAEIDKIVKMLL